MHGIHARTTCPSYRARRSGRRSPAMPGEQVWVIGGANSAGRAALHLAKIRRPGSRCSYGASRWPPACPTTPITPLKATPNIEVRLRTRVAGGHSQARLEALELEDVPTGQRE